MFLYFIIYCETFRGMYLGNRVVFEGQDMKRARASMVDLLGSWGYVFLCCSGGSL